MRLNPDNLPPRLMNILKYRFNRIRWRNRGWFDKKRRWHDDDCGGCDGCGWIDKNLGWWPGPCPTKDKPFQASRSEGT